MALTSIPCRIQTIKLFIIIGSLTVVCVIYFENHSIKEYTTLLVAKVSGKQNKYPPLEGNHERNSSVSRTCMASITCEENQRRKELPSVILIGEQKTGTGTIQTFLRTLNNRVSFADLEPHFFDMIVNCKPHLLPQDLKAYKNLMKPSCPGDVVMEKTPRYF